MKYSLKIVLVLFRVFVGAQKKSLRLWAAVTTSSQDSVPYLICLDIYGFYDEINKDSAFYCSKDTWRRMKVETQRRGNYLLYSHTNCCFIKTIIHEHN